MILSSLVSLKSYRSFLNDFLLAEIAGNYMSKIRQSKKDEINKKIILACKNDPNHTKELSKKEN